MTSTWKHTERAVAQALGGKRTGNSGRNTADVDHAWLAPEVKHRQTLPGWLHDAITQARSNAAPDRLPIVVLHESGRRHEHDLIVIRLDDWLEWFGAGLDVSEQTA